VRNRLATGDARFFAHRHGCADDNGQPPGTLPDSTPVPWKTGLILLDQMRTLDKQRLVRRLGAVSGNTLRLALAALREMFEE
jgi:hypothetical protein